MRSYQVLAGQYGNVATVTATTGTGTIGFDDDAAFHTGNVVGIRVEKAINAVNPFAPTALELAEAAPGRQLAVGTSVVWTYQVFNNGSAPVAVTSIRDDAGTPANPADDFTPLPVLQTATSFNIGDSDRDALLDTTEVWLYTSSGVHVGTTSAVDWAQVSQDVIRVTNTSTTGTGFTVDPVNIVLGDDIFTGGSTKDIQGVSKWLWKQHTPQDKDDIAHAFGSAVADGTSGHQLLFGGLDRFAANGNATVGFWFFQNVVTKDSGGTFKGIHRDGDILLVVNFTQGGHVNSVTGYRWTGSETAGTLVALNAPAGALFADVNSAPVSVPWSFRDKWGYTSPQSGELIRAGLDMTAIFGANVPTFASFLAETRSSQLTTATLSDFALGSMGNVTTGYHVKPGQYGNVVTVAAVDQNVGLTVTDSDANFHFGVLPAANLGQQGNNLLLTGAQPSPIATVASLTSADLKRITANAKALWSNSNPGAAKTLRNVDVQVVDLSGNELGLTSGNTILIDINAAGSGWFVDQTPRRNHEFLSVAGEWVAKNGSAAVGRVDLLTVVAHELGHVLGLDHTLEGVAGPAIMEDTIQPGIRRLPGAPADEAPTQIIESASRRADFTDIQHLISRFGHELPGAETHHKASASSSARAESDLRAILRESESLSHQHHLFHEQVLLAPERRDSSVGQSVAQYLAALSKKTFALDPEDQ